MLCRALACYFAASKTAAALQDSIQFFLTPYWC